VTPWAPAVLVYQEVWAALAVLAVDAGLMAAGDMAHRPVWRTGSGGRCTRRRRLYVAVNVPIARQFATPLTYAFLEAAGGALSDSITAYATPEQRAALVRGGAGGRGGRAAVDPRAPGRRAAGERRGGRWCSGRSGRGAATRSGCTAARWRRWRRRRWARWAAGAAEGFAATALPAEGPALDLSHLRGAARGFNVDVGDPRVDRGAPPAELRGGGRRDAERLTALARRGLVFERMYTSYPESIKSSAADLLCASIRRSTRRPATTRRALGVRAAGARR
jgi:hypothetical protein